MLNNKKRPKIYEWLDHVEVKASKVYLFYTVLGFLLIRLLFRHLLGVNEADTVPVAKAFMDGNWITQDWYLNLSIGYRYLFNFFIGFIAKFSSFTLTSLVGRVLAIFFWSLVLTGFIKRLNISIFFIILLLWLITKEQSIIAGEWMLNALETKTFSYIALMASFLFLSRRKYFIASFLLGLSVSFHILVGGYGTIGIILLLLFEHKNFKIDFRTLIIAAGIYLIAASFGIYAIFETLFLGPAVDKIRAGLIYVYTRVPHHVLPSYWISRGGLWKPFIKLTFSLLIVIPSAIRPWSSFVRLFSRFTIITMTFAAVGFGFYFTGRYDLLKYYPFRLPDTMLPVSAFFLFCSYISREEFRIGSVFTNKNRKIIAILLSIIIFIGIGTSFIKSIDRYIKDPEYYLSKRTKENPERKLYEWIRSNTPHNSVFLIPPMERDFFLVAQRAQFVDYKHSPQSEADIIEWYHRLVLLSGKEDDRTGYKLDFKDISANYFKISLKNIDNLLKEYRIDYYIGLRREDLPFKKVFESENLALYDLNTGKHIE